MASRPAASSLVWCALVACGGPGSASSIDAGSTVEPDPFDSSVTVYVALQTILNDGSGTPMAPATMDLFADHVTATATLGDGIGLAVEWPFNGAFTFPTHRTGEPYAVSVSIDGGSPVVYESTTSSLDIGEQVVGRVGRPSTLATPITLATPGYAFTLGDELVVDSTGIWTATPIGSGAVAGDAQFGLDWHAAQPVAGSNGVLDAVFDDRLAIAALTGSGDHAAITSFGSIDTATFVDGMPDSVTIPMAAPAADQLRCVQLDADPTTIVPALVAAFPDLAGAPAESDWRATATGAAPYAAPAGLLLAAGSAAAVAESLTFANPFVHTSTVISVGGAISGTVGLPGRTPIAIATELRVFDALPDASSCTGTPPTLSLGPDEIAVPSRATIAGVAPAAGQAIELDTTAAQPVAWTLAAAGEVDHFEVVVFELVPDGTTDDLVERVRIVTPVPSTTATILPYTLATGHAYAVEVIARRGTPKASAGDFFTGGLPVAVATSVTPAFVVKAP